MKTRTARKTICRKSRKGAKPGHPPATLLTGKAVKGVPRARLQPPTKKPKNKKSNTNMSTKIKTPPNGGASDTTASSEPRTYRINSEVEAKIDNWIKQNPKDWDYIQAMPVDRLRRSMVLHEVRQIDRQQRVREFTMNRINADPKLKAAYETLVKDVPEDQREEVMTQMARQKQRTVARSQNEPQTQTVTV